MKDRTGIKTALASIGYHLSDYIDTDVELYIAGRDGKKFALILLDNRSDLVNGKISVERVFYLAKNSRSIQGDNSFNIFMLITDICKDRHLTNLRNVLYFNEGDYTLKGKNVDSVFNNEVAQIRKLFECLGNEKLYFRKSAGMASINKEHKVILTPILIIMNIALYLFFNDKNDMYGVSKALVEDGQIYRMLTYAFMHAGILHLAFNMLSLGIIGRVLEKQIGWASMLFVYISAAIVGAEISVKFAANTETITVGASGAICGLIAANVVSVAFLPRERHGTAISSSIIWLLTIFVYGTFRNVDNMCHMGGAFGGLIAMLILAFAVQTVFLGNVADANRYHFERLAEQRKRMFRTDGSRDNNPNIFILEDR